MPQFSIAASNGTVRLDNRNRNKDFVHDIAFDVDGATGGSMTLRGRKRGGGIFETITPTPIDLSNAVSLSVQGTIEEFEVVLNGVTGGGQIIITDTSKEI